MEKKVLYLKPEIEVIEMESQSQIMVGSTPPKKDVTFDLDSEDTTDGFFD